MTLTKSQITDKIRTNIKSSKKQSTDTIETLLEIINHTFASSDDVLISGFGKFCVKEKAERRGRNPARQEGLHSFQFYA